MQEDDNLTKEQIEEEIKKIKAAHAEDEGTSHFPDPTMMSIFFSSTEKICFIADVFFSPFVFQNIQMKWILHWTILLENVSPNIEVSSHSGPLHGTQR